MANISTDHGVLVKQEYDEEDEIENDYPDENYTDKGVLVKQELVEEDRNDYNLIEEADDPNPWLMENAEAFLKYCCSNCEFSTKDVKDFSNHVATYHFSSNMLFQNKAKRIRKSMSITRGSNEYTNIVRKLRIGKCSVPNCDVKKSFRFFKFPKQQEKLDSWLQLCGLTMVQNEDRICADHFNHSDFYVDLKGNACPSLNLNIAQRQEIPNTGTVVAKMNLLEPILNPFFGSQLYLRTKIYSLRPSAVL